MPSPTQCGKSRRPQEWLEKPTPGTPSLPAPRRQVAPGRLPGRQRREPRVRTHRLPALGQQRARMEVADSLLGNGSDVPPPCELGLENETLVCLEQPRAAQGRRRPPALSIPPR